MIECYCGETIQEIQLPRDVAQASGVETIWVHTLTNQVQCYEDDPDCTATPLTVHSSMRGR